MGSSAEGEYEAFLAKVERTVYVDNLSPQVTEAVMKAAFNQFATVNSVQFIPNYREPKNMARSALVELKNAKQARLIISEMDNFPFMVSGMPRPVRARAAQAEMFESRPRKPGRRIFCRWLDPKEPDFEVAQRVKKLVRQQDAEASFLLEQELAEEARLHNQQAEILKAQYRKFELIDKVAEDGTAKRLAHHYNMQITGP